MSSITRLSRNITIVGSSTLTAANIRKGIKIFGVTGTWEGWVDQNLYIIKNGVAQIPVTVSWKWWSGGSWSGTPDTTKGSGSSANTSNGGYGVTFAQTRYYVSGNVTEWTSGTVTLSYQIPGINTDRKRTIYADIGYNVGSISGAADASTLKYHSWCGVGARSSVYRWRKTISSSAMTYAYVDSSSSRNILISKNYTFGSNSVASKTFTKSLSSNTSKYEYGWDASGRQQFTFYTATDADAGYNTYFNNHRVYVTNLWVLTK